MKKKLFLRSLIGAPVGLAISTLITVIISLCLGTGDFYAAQPELIDDCGNEINAVLLQTLCSLILGGICGGSSIIWDDEKRSLLFQTGLHFIIISVSVFLTAFFLHWMPHTVGGILGYFGIFTAVYVGIWLSSYFRIRAKIKKLNSQLTKKQ